MPAVDSEEEDADGRRGDEAEVDDGDFLSGFPDDTPVCVGTSTTDCLCQPL